MTEQKPYQFKKSDNPKWSHRVVARDDGTVLGYLRYVVKWPGVAEYWVCDKWPAIDCDGWANHHEVTFRTRDEAAQRLMTERQATR